MFKFSLIVLTIGILIQATNGQQTNESYVIENGVVTSTFASVNPLFFDLYSFFDGPGSKSNDTFYSSDTNGSYAQQSFYDVLTNTVNNSTLFLEQIDISLFSTPLTSNCSLANDYLNYLKTNKDAITPYRLISLLPCKTECNITEFIDLGITSFKSLASYIPFLPSSSNCYIELSNITNQCLNQISNSYSISSFDGIFNTTAYGQSSSSSLNLASLNITSIVSNAFTGNTSNSFSRSNFSTISNPFSANPSSSFLVLNYTSSNMLSYLNYSSLNANSTLNVDCSALQPMDNMVSFKIEQSTIQNIFSSVDGIFLKIYQMANAPGSQGDQFVLKDGTNAAQLKQEYIDNLNNTVGNITILLQKIDEISSSVWASNCEISNQFFEYLENQTNANQSVANIDRLSKVFQCQSDCNNTQLVAFGITTYDSLSQLLLNSLTDSYCAAYLDELLGNMGIQGVTDISALTTAATTANPFLPPDAISDDILSNITSLENLDFSTISSILSQYSGYGIADLFTQDQLDNLPLSVMLELANSSFSFDEEAIMAMGNNIPENSSFADIAKFMGSAPVEILFNADPDAIADKLDEINFDTVDPVREAGMVNKVLERVSESNINAILAVPSLVNLIPLSTLLNSNISLDSLPASKLPDSAVADYAAKKIENSTIDDLLFQNTTILSKVITGLRPSDFNNISDSSKFTGVLNLVSAAASAKPLTNIQRTAMFNTLVDGAAYMVNISDPLDNINRTFSVFNSSVYSRAANLFVDAPYNYLDALSIRDKSSFGFVLTKVSTIGVKDCSSYTYAARNNFTQYAVQYILNRNNRRVLLASDLDTLGPCFAPNIPIQYFRNMSATDFLTKISYFQGTQFVPDNDWCTELTNKITQLRLTRNDTFLFSRLGELSIFHPDLTSVNKTAFAASGKLINKNARSNKNPQDSDVQAGSIGIDDLSSLTAAFSSWQSAYVSYMVGNNATSRRRRSVYNTITCNQLTNGPPNAFTASQLSGLSPAVFQSCLTTLGASTNTYSSDQITALATLAQSIYTVYNDTTVRGLGVILTGFPTTTLQSITVTSDSTLSVLGAVSSWSSSQITALMTALTNNNVNITAKLSVLGNLVCGLSTTQVNSIPSSTFSASIASFKVINNQGNCASLSSLYTKAKTIFSYGTLTASSVLDLNGLVGGASVSDLTAAGSNVFLSLTATALKNLPATTVNSLPTTYISSATASQLSAFKNSPYYSSFSDSIKNTVIAASAGRTASTGTTASASGTTARSVTGSSERVVFSLKNSFLCLIMGIIMIMF